ncbi:hypothetical protein D3C71_1618840 [compost metagenome]
MTWLVDRYKSNGQFEAAGRIAKATNAGRSYGCHFGMKSTRDRDMAVFFEAYDAYTPPTSFDVYWAQGLYEADCSKERIKEMVGAWDHDANLAADGYANDYVDVFPVCIVPHLAGLHSEGVAHIEANGPK